jgi:integrase/recombinase XerD
VIALWLGHESTATTHMYVEADLTMKKRAIDKITASVSMSRQYRPSDRLLAFLEALRLCAVRHPTELGLTDPLRP